MARSAAVRRVDDTRQQVLDAVLALFAERGYFATSIQDISRESAVSVGSIYHHFGDKEGIARALYQALSDRMSSRISWISARHASVHDQCRGIVETLFEMTEREPLVMDFMLYAKHKDFLPEEKPICSSRPFELMRTIVAAGMESGEIRRMDVMVASTSLFGGPIRMIVARLDAVLQVPLSRHLDEVWECAWRSVAAR
ncbi:MAG: TetR/AcrR family transcriptional regulator [Burkholderiaceae bacterium]|nr:TetR/AcrR family transcriptional regulator [Burkholderiaceae bacterium]